MEIADLAMVCKEVKLKALFNRFVRHLVGIGGPSSILHHALVHGDVAGADSIAQ